ncbi:MULTISPECIES: cysteine hydrolase family protein [unclassified Geodermatophilus]|uniref:cysteine hydrolase family protein n=1 Tax=unclassified Geodermatophilus TaxID=2637632 RepID=UPI003EEF263A
MALPRTATLLVVDVQEAFDDPSWGARNNPSAESNIGALLDRWRSTGRPVVHVQHRNPAPGSLFHPDAPGHRFKPVAAPLPGEAVVHKSVNSAFIGTDLERRLRARAEVDLVICGLTTDHCVSTTTRMAGNLGFRARLVGDATATFERTGPDGRHYGADLVHDTALASLHGEFADVVATEDVLLDR